MVPIGDSPTRGPADAWVTIVEFGDYQCPYCGAVESTIHQLDAERPGLRWVWKDFPLSQHARALPAAIAAQCAYAQGQFWPMHDLLYQNQSALSDTDLAGYAQQLGLDMTQWQNCVTEQQPAEHISADLQQADRARVDGTPTFFVNGIALVGNLPLRDFLSTVDEAQSSALATGDSQGSYYASRENQGCL
jgi:protein-disulfide isomerase